MPTRYPAALFDLPSALLDSWSLWDALAGGRDAGRRWRLRYLELTYAAGRYEPYLELVARAAADTGLPPSLADALEARWDELRSWPEVPALLAALPTHVKTGVVTNCSEALGLRAARMAGRFDVVMTAERAGSYKPRSGIYRAALLELGMAPDRVLFIAGSPLDVPGAAALGMDVYWHNRIGLADAAAASIAKITAGDLCDVARWLSGGTKTAG
jgi:2-haloalkanoic acid dehalogenase type II